MLRGREYRQVEKMTEEAKAVRFKALLTTLSARQKRVKQNTGENLMLITEYEGSGRLCPVRHYYDTDDERYEDRDCETTACMAWRWYDKPGTEERRGYCGLGGKPQHDE